MNAHQLTTVTSTLDAPILLDLSSALVVVATQETEPIAKVIKLNEQQHFSPASPHC